MSSTSGRSLAFILASGRSAAGLAGGVASLGLVLFMVVIGQGDGRWDKKGQRGSLVSSKDHASILGGLKAALKRCQITSRLPMIRPSESLFHPLIALNLWF
jgi:hypothetical protein